MAKWKTPASAANKPLPSPKPESIKHEVPYRGRRIVLTDDPRLVGAPYPDKWGFTTDQGFVVLDEFDEIEFPVGMHWFWTPDDAACAIELLDTILPTIKEGTPATTLLYEHGIMRAYRREFWHVYHALADIRKACDDAVAFGDNPCEDIVKRLHFLRQQVAQGKSIG
jgi:hypothetical protein